VCCDKLEIEKLYFLRIATEQGMHTDAAKPNVVEMCVQTSTGQARNSKLWDQSSDLDM
jgi:hypothetical protein